MSIFEPTVFHLELLVIESRSLERRKRSYLCGLAVQRPLRSNCDPFEDSPKVRNVRNRQGQWRASFFFLSSSEALLTQIEPKWNEVKWPFKLWISKASMRLLEEAEMGEIKNSNLMLISFSVLICSNQWILRFPSGLCIFFAFSFIHPLLCAFFFTFSVSSFASSIHPLLLLFLQCSPLHLFLFNLFFSLNILFFSLNILFVARSSPR